MQTLFSEQLLCRKERVQGASFVEYRLNSSHPVLQSILKEGHKDDHCSVPRKDMKRVQSWDREEKRLVSGWIKNTRTVQVSSVCQSNLACLCSFYPAVKELVRICERKHMKFTQNTPQAVHSWLFFFLAFGGENKGFGKSWGKMSYQAIISMSLMYMHILLWD